MVKVTEELLIHTLKEDKKRCVALPSHAFVICDGRRIYSLVEMTAAVSEMDEKTFAAHVNREKNDIANWTEDIFLHKELAQKLRQTTSKALTARILENFATGERINDCIAESKNPDRQILPDGHQSYEKQNEKKDGKTQKNKPSGGEEGVNLFEEEAIPNNNSLCYEKLNIKENTPFFLRIKKAFKKIARRRSLKKAENKKVQENIASEKTITTINDITDNAPGEDMNQNPLQMPGFGDEEEAYVPQFMKTGITGFDELLEKGIPRGSSVLLCGGAGSGKTTFSLHIMNNAAQRKEKCLYLTFEEDVSRLKAHMKDFGWDAAGLQKEGYLKIKKMDPFEISRSVEALLAKASGELIIDIDEVSGILPEGFRPDIIVLDSLSAVAAAFVGKEEGYRIYVEQLFNMFRKIGATSFLISEVEENTNKYTRTGIEEFLADAVIVFYSLRQKSVRVNAIEIIKVRGTAHQKKIVPFKMITGQGIAVFPKEDPFLE